MCDTGGEGMECRQFFGDTNALFEPKPLRDILSLQEHTGGPAIISAQFDRADTNRLGSAVEARIRHVFLAHMPVALECPVEGFTDDFTAGKDGFIRVPEEISRRPFQDR